MFVFLASGLSLCYMFGFGIQFLVNVAIVSKTDWKEMSGLMLIISLGVSDMSACLAFGVGCLQAALGIQLVPLSGLIEGTFSLVCWSSGCLHMIALSYNRLVAILWPTTRYPRWCAPKPTLWLLVSCWSLALVTTAVNQTLAYPIKFYIETATHYHDFSLNLTDHRAAQILDKFYQCFAMTSVFIPLVFYMIITTSLVKHKLSVGNMNSSWDLSLCFQFFIIVAVSASINMGWHFLWPLSHIPTIGVGLRVANLLMFSVNGYVYLVFNKTIRTAVKKMFVKQVGNSTAQRNTTKNRKRERK